MGHSPGISPSAEAGTTLTQMAVLEMLATVAAFIAVMAGLVWLTRRQRGRQVGGSVAGPFEEIWHPAAHRARVEIQVQDERTLPAPSPGDPPAEATGVPDSVVPPGSDRDRDRPAGGRA